MSSLKHLSTLVLLLLLATSLTLAYDVDTDPVILYYWDHARTAARLTNPDSSDICYSFTARTYKRTVGEDGLIKKTDSVLQEYFFCRGHLDSMNTLQGDAGRFRALDLSYPPVFENNYHLSLFPNDIGGPRLAIRIWSDSTMGRKPDGLVVIDRNEYHPYSLYLYYPNKPDYQRFTRSFRFVMVDGFVFPDSVWEVATRLGVFYPECYRLETGISNVRIRRAEVPRGD